MNLLPVAATERPTDQPLTRQAIEAKGRSAPLKVTGKLKTAVDAMVWLGLRRKEAAEHAGMKHKGIEAALSKPHVKQYYLSQLEVLRTSERARNIHRLTEIRDKADNMPAVNAIKMLEQIDEAQSHAGGAQLRSPGVVIVVQGRGPEPCRGRVIVVQGNAQMSNINDLGEIGRSGPTSDTRKDERS